MNWLLTKPRRNDGHKLSRYSMADDVRGTFDCCRAELDSLAFLLTGDRQLAHACVADACALATTQYDFFHDSLEQWVRRSTIRSALEIQHSQIAALSRAYERRPCPHRGHASLTRGVQIVIPERSEALGPYLDVFCRAALVVRGIESYSQTEAALMLGVSRTALQSAYCAALQSLMLVSREVLQSSTATHNR